MALLYFLLLDESYPQMQRFTMGLLRDLNNANGLWMAIG